jgi:putative FmdB family regulatory protein
MPLYTFVCLPCDATFEVYRPISEGSAKPEPCPSCERYCKRLFAPVQLNIFNGFVTPHITGEPVRIESRQQLSELCRSRGVRPDDGDTRRSVLPKEDAPPLHELFEQESQKIRYGKHEKYNAIKYGDAPDPVARMRIG